MTSVYEKIHYASTHHAHLLQGLQETESAPSKLQQHAAYIADLNAQIAQTHKRVEDLRRKTNSELEDHKKYSESRYRRFVHKASGRKERFAEKAAKEEREYFVAIQSQKTAEDELAYVKQLKAEAETQKEALEISAQRHSLLQTELHNLYHDLFSGHTPDFPDEDAKESACVVASQHLQTLNQTLERTRHILFLLRQTSTKLTEARNHLDSAHTASSMDMFGGGALISIQKRNHLERAESSIQQVRMLQQQLYHLAPELPLLGDMNIASGSIWGDVYFDNIFSDSDMHDRIKVSEAQVDKVGHRCGELVRDVEISEENLLQDVKRGEERLKNARMELQRAREHAVRQVLGEWEPISGAPPAYSV